MAFTDRSLDIPVCCCGEEEENFNDLVPGRNLSVGQSGRHQKKIRYMVGV